MCLNKYEPKAFRWPRGQLPGVGLERGLVLINNINWTTGFKRRTPADKVRPEKPAASTCAKSLKPHGSRSLGLCALEGCASLLHAFGAFFVFGISVAKIEHMPFNEIRSVIM